MTIIIYLASLLGGFLLSLLWKPSHGLLNVLSKIYLWLVLLSVAGSWIFYFAGIKNAMVLDVMTQALKWIGIVAHVLLAYLLGRMLFTLKTIPADARALRPTLNTALWAVGISYGSTFLIATVGKSTNMTGMISFFTQSGYGTWFLYFIMAAETAGAIGVLAHYWLRTGIPATIGLMLVMLGAVYTHWHNGDPFSNSYAAVSLLISGSMLLMLYSLERRVNRLVPKAAFQPLT